MAPRRQRGFSLIELVGVISVIAILLTLLIPRIYRVVNNSRITHAVMTYRSMEAGVWAHYARWHGFVKADGSPFAPDDYPVEDYDRILFEGGYLEEPFFLYIGNGLSGDDGDPAMNPETDGARLRLLDISGLSRGDPVTAGDHDISGSYCLHPPATTPLGADSPTPENPGVDTVGSFLVEAVIPGVLVEDARELNNRIDGRRRVYGAQEWGDGEGGTVTADYTGRVKWEQGEGGRVTMFIYVAHR